MTRLILAGLVGALFMAPAARAQQPGMDSRDSARRMGTGMGREMMMADSMDARLDALVATMNKASGDKQVQAMAAVINELVAQRKAMRARMHQMMESGDMRRRGDHMMRGMKHADSTAAADSSGHQHQ